MNDDFSTLPKPLQEIINNPEKRKKLVVYINPPYAEATTARTITGTGKNKSGVATENKVNQYFNAKIGNASNEIFTLFMAQVYTKIPDCFLAQFSTLKFVQGSNFSKFKEYFLANYLGGFIVPANTFDNVKGKFPIGFTVWDLKNKTKFENIKCDVFEKDATKFGEKVFYSNLSKSINKWFKEYNNCLNDNLGLVVGCPPDFQHNNQLAILAKQQERYCLKICKENIIQFCVYFSVRHCIPATWLNDRDQFLFPNKKWEKDKEFQNDCLAFALFNSQNKITSKDGVNHWIPFTESEVNAREKFDSNFMSKFIKGKIKPEDKPTIFTTLSEPKTHYEVPLNFSDEANFVFNAGRELWRYYHASFANVQNFGEAGYNVNASLYDIREYFQGRNEKGKMNNKSEDETYMKLISDLRDSLKLLAQKIEPKVYEYEFLKE